MNTNFPIDLRLWQLISPALPVGAYAYSQGMEYAVYSGDIKNKSDATNWIEGLLLNSYCALDLAVFTRLYQACRQYNEAAFNYWNSQLLSFRESRELLAEDLQMGSALLRLISDLELSVGFHCNEPSYAAIFAQAAFTWQIDEKMAAHGLAWSWCENQVAAAIKLIPLGQTDGQRLLMALAERIPEAVDKAWALDDAEIGFSSPGLAMASALHEGQYSRLFRS